MRKKSKNKCVSTIIASLLAMLLTVPLFSAEYNYTYAFEQPEVKKQDNNRYLLEMKDTWLKDDIVGDPMLPVKTAKIFISAHEKVASIEIAYGPLHTIAGTYLIQHALTPYPISYKGPVIIDKANPHIYEKDELYPPVSFREKTPQFVRGVQVLPVDLMPVLYNPLKGTVQYYEKMEVKITTVKQKRPDWVMPFRNSRKDRKNILKTIDNDTDFIKVHPLAAEQTQPPASSESTVEPLQESTSSIPSPLGTREYVVITTSDLIEAFTTLTDHRASLPGGDYTTHIEDIANINTSYAGRDLAEKMRNFVIDMYRNYGTQYVLLGGDCDGPSDQQVIPTRGCYAVVGSTTDHDIPADLYFGCLDGSWNGDGDANWGEANDGEGGGDIDWASEVYVGRIAADTSTEALNHIAKIIAFETAADLPNKTLLVGEKLDNRTWGGDRMDWVYTYMHSTPKTELYDKTAIWSTNDLLNVIYTDEHHWINHLGHANVTYDMKMSNPDVESMSNSNYLLIYTQGCYPGSMDSRGTGTSYYSSDCFGEAVTNGYSDRGAFAFIGNSRYGWYNPGDYVEGASNLAHKEFVEAIFTNGYTKLGEANQISKTDLDLEYGLYRWISFASNLLGCPATDMSQLNDQNEAPTAAFSFSTSDLTVTLTDNSTDSDGSIASWAWDFGDSNSSTTQNPTHTYTSAGTYTVTLTVTDNDGASNSDSKPVTVTEPPPPDTEAPSITAPTDVSVEATGVTTTVDLGSPIVSDNVDPNPIVTNDAPDTFPVGTTTVTWTATDASGNVASPATQTVTVNDTTAPTITAPADVNVQSSEPIAVDLGTPTVSDLVDPNPIISNDAPTLFPVGTTVVTWTTTDSSNNTATAKQTVTVTESSNNVTDYTPSISSISASGSTVSLTWYYNLNANEEGFYIESAKKIRGKYNFSLIPKVSVAANTSSFNHVDVEEGTYKYRIRAYNGNTYSPYSLEVLVKVEGSSTPPPPDDTPAAPTLSVTVNSVTVNSFEVALIWTDCLSEECSYSLVRASKAEGRSIFSEIYNGENVPFYILESIGTYYYKVKAINESGESDYSKVITVRLK